MGIHSELMGVIILKNCDFVILHGIISWDLIDEWGLTNHSGDIMGIFHETLTILNKQQVIL